MNKTLGQGPNIRNNEGKLETLKAEVIKDIVKLCPYVYRAKGDSSTDTYPSTRASGKTAEPEHNTSFDAPEAPTTEGTTEEISSPGSEDNTCNKDSEDHNNKNNPYITSVDLQLTIQRVKFEAENNLTLAKAVLQWKSPI